MTIQEEKLHSMQKTLNYEFSDIQLLIQALTHSSYANEIDNSLQNNERLEFLGDAVLELCISEQLFLRYPDSREGELTNLRAKLVSEPTLAKLAKEIKLQDYLLLGKGEETQGGRERDAIMADGLESILGAIFLDGGFKNSQEVILYLYQNLWPAKEEVRPRKDYKSKLQELTQKLFKERPTYSLIDSYGPEHDKTYLVRVILPDQESFQAEESSIKKAEQMAAKTAILELDSKELP